MNKYQRKKEKKESKLRLFKLVFGDINILEESNVSVS